MSIRQASNMMRTHSYIHQLCRPAGRAHNSQQMDAEQLEERIARVGRDHESGASELVGEVMSILSAALKAGVPLAPLCRALIHAQPSMAPVWSAVSAALGAPSAEVFGRYILA